jgi:hypothetical protein
VSEAEASNNGDSGDEDGDADAEGYGEENKEPEAFFAELKQGWSCGVFVDSV